MGKIECSFHVDMCPDCGAVPFQHPMDAPWYCDHPRDRYVMIECAPTDQLEGAVEAERARVVALIREKAEDKDYATMCSWRALASELEGGQ